MAFNHEPDPADRRSRSSTAISAAPSSGASSTRGRGLPRPPAFAGVDLRVLDPLVHMDQMGEVDYAPGEPKGTPWHPHRGFETVTYMITASSGTRTPTAAAASSPTATPSG
jgi:quercetin 2,3-dioxygenase